jgi:hypothetical protein
MMAVPPEDLSSFPELHLSPGSRWYRRHSAEHDPSTPSSSPLRFSFPENGSFHPALYFSSSPEVAILGLLVSTVITLSELKLFAISEFALISPIRAADFAVPACRRWGITPDLYLGSNFRRAQAWAQQLHKAGFDAIQWPSVVNPYDLKLVVFEHARSKFELVDTRSADTFLPERALSASDPRALQHALWTGATSIDNSL